MNYIDAAAMFNRLRAIMTTESQHDALDAEVSTFADTLTDREQRDDFMSRTVYGILPSDHANIADVILCAFEVAQTLSYHSIVEWCDDAIIDAADRHLRLSVGDVLRMLVSEGKLVRMPNPSFFSRKA